MGLQIGAVNEEGLRGTLAARDYEEGEILAAVPFNCTIDVGPQAWTAPVRFLFLSPQVFLSFVLVFWHSIFLLY